MYKNAEVSRFSCELFLQEQLNPSVRRKKNTNIFKLTSNTSIHTAFRKNPISECRRQLQPQGYPKTKKTASNRTSNRSSTPKVHQNETKNTWKERRSHRKSGKLPDQFRQPQLPKLECADFGFLPHSGRKMATFPTFHPSFLLKKPFRAHVIRDPHRQV